MTKAPLKKRPGKGNTFAEIQFDARQFFLERNLSLGHGHKRAAFDLYCEHFNARRRDLRSAVFADWPRLDYDVLRKAWAAFEQDGPAGLNDRRTGEHNRERSYFHEHPDQRIAAEELVHLNRRLQSSDEALFRILIERLRQQGATVLPTLKQVRAFRVAYVTDHANELAALRNPDRAKATMRPAFGDMAASVTRPNEVVELDFTPANCLGSDGRRAAHIGTAIDVHTRRRVDVLVDRPSADAVAEVLKAYIVAHGVPSSVRIDNGKEFVNQRILLGCRAFHIAVDIVPPYSGDRKPFVERAHRTLSDEVFPLLETYTGRNVAERQSLREEATFSVRGRETARATANGLSRDELQQVIDDWSIAYHNRKHSSLGCSPNVMAARHRGAWTRLDPEQYPLLALHFARPAGRGVATVGKEGLRIAGYDYHAPELALPKFSGQRVSVREHPTDAGRVMVYEAEDQFLCIAVNPELAGVDRAELAAICRATFESARKELGRRRREFKRNSPSVQKLAVDSWRREADGHRNLRVLADIQPHEAPGLVAAQQAHDAMSAQASAIERERAAPARAKPAFDFQRDEMRTFSSDDDRLAFWGELHERIEGGQPVHARHHAWYANNAEDYRPGYLALREFEARTAKKASAA